MQIFNLFLFLSITCSICSSCLTSNSQSSQPVSESKLAYRSAELVSELRLTTITDSTLANSIQQGDYQPLLSSSAIEKIDSLIRIDHGLGHYFDQDIATLQNIRDSIQALPLEDSIPAKLLVYKELQLRKVATKYHKAMTFGVVNPYNVYPSGFYVPLQTADEKWHAQQYSQKMYINTLLETKPKNKLYEPLRSTYASWKSTLDSSWQELPALPKRKIVEGDTYSGTPILRQRFSMPPVADSLDSYLIVDSLLITQLKQFQSNYGLIADGILGSSTLAILNTSPAKQQQKIEASLERFRWNSQVQYDSLLMINIAEYKLHVFEDNKEVQNHKVCVGIAANDYKTPEFLDTLKYVEVNPQWYVPRSIATKEILRDQKNDSTYISRNNYDVFIGSEKIEPGSVDWQSYTESNLPYRFVQTAGSYNALGRIKFLFPNRFSIYLHDTPSKRFFERDKRAVSHGCIRLDDPFRLGDFIMKNDKKYLDAKDSDETVRFIAKKRYPIWITYYTAWADDNKIRFRNDVYKKDDALMDALFALTNEKVIQ